jgi:hypothetical protein
MRALPSPIIVSEFLRRTAQRGSDLHDRRGEPLLHKGHRLPDLLGARLDGSDWSSRGVSLDGGNVNRVACRGWLFAAIYPDRPSEYFVGSHS